MLHFVTSYMKQNKSRKQTLKSAQYALEISFKVEDRNVIKEFCFSAFFMSEVVHPRSPTTDLWCHSAFL